MVDTCLVICFILNRGAETVIFDDVTRKENQKDAWCQKLNLKHFSAHPYDTLFVKICFTLSVA